MRNYDFGIGWLIPNDKDDLFINTLKEPVLYGFPSGHVKHGEVNITIPLGIPITLNADVTEIIINQSAVL